MCAINFRKRGVILLSSFQEITVNLVKIFEGQLATVPGLSSPRESTVAAVAQG